MTDTQENHLSRAEKVSEFIDVNSTDLTLTPAVTGALKTELDQRIDKVQEVATLADQDNTGYAAEKEDTRTDLEKSVDLVSSALASYADDQEDLVLLNMVDFPPSTIEGFRDNRLIQFAKYIHGKAIAPAVAAVLATDHGVVAADLTALNTLRAEYEDWNPQPMEKKGETAGLHLALQKEIDKMNDTVRKIDLKVQIYRQKNNTLFLMWAAVVKIDDTGSGSGSQTFSGNIAGSGSAKVADITYDAAKALELKSLDTANLQFSIMQDGNPVVGETPVTVNGGNTLNTTEGALAPSGNQLWVRNLSVVAGNYVVKVG